MVRTHILILETYIHVLGRRGVKYTTRKLIEYVIETHPSLLTIRTRARDSMYTFKWFLLRQEFSRAQIHTYGNSFAQVRPTIC